MERRDRSIDSILCRISNPDGELSGFLTSNERHLSVLDEKGRDICVG